MEPASNFERMIQLATDVFDVRNDPDQLDVSEDVISGLQRIHSATLSEYDEGNGPAVWILLIPTTEELMNEFLHKEINEKELYEQTPENVKYDAIYLCSALVLPEYRRKGIATRLSVDAIRSIRKDHPIRKLFVWPFSEEGRLLSKKIAKLAGLQLLERGK